MHELWHEVRSINNNDIFLFGLNPYEIMIYSHLVSCADSKGECWPSCKTMERKLVISINTIMPLSGTH